MGGGVGEEERKNVFAHFLWLILGSAGKDKLPLNMQIIKNLMISVLNSWSKTKQQ